MSVRRSHGSLAHWTQPRFRFKCEACVQRSQAMQDQLGHGLRGVPFMNGAMLFDCAAGAQLTQVASCLEPPNSWNARSRAPAKRNPAAALDRVARIGGRTTCSSAGRCLRAQCERRDRSYRTCRLPTMSCGGPRMSPPRVRCCPSFVDRMIVAARYRTSTTAAPRCAASVLGANDGQPPDRLEQVDRIRICHAGAAHATRATIAHRDGRSHACRLLEIPAGSSTRRLRPR
jgi:hypothetical protein